MMKNYVIWFYVIGAVAVAVLANYIATMWASAEHKPLWFLALLVISPLVFITFGLTTSKVGVTIASGTIDSLLTMSTIVLGLFIFQEWSKLSVFQYAGIVFALCGIFLMVFFPKVSN